MQNTEKCDPYREKNKTKDRQKKISLKRFQ